MKPIGIGMVAAALAWTACSRAPESQITAVEARIDGITCPTCVPPLQNTLKRAYAQSTVDVDEATNTATVHFAAGDHFSASKFRAAVERVRMRVVTFHMEACGTVTMADGAAWMSVPGDRLAVRSDRNLPLGKSICATGALDTRTNPATFQIASFK